MLYVALVYEVNDNINTQTAIPTCDESCFYCCLSCYSTVTDFCFLFVCLFGALVLSLSACLCPRLLHERSEHEGGTYIGLCGIVARPFVVAVVVVIV